MICACLYGGTFPLRAPKTIFYFPTDLSHLRIVSQTLFSGVAYSVPIWAPICVHISIHSHLCGVFPIFPSLPRFRALSLVPKWTQLKKFSIYKEKWTWYYSFPERISSFLFHWEDIINGCQKLFKKLVTDSPLLNAQGLFSLCKNLSLSQELLNQKHKGKNHGMRYP